MKIENKKFKEELENRLPKYLLDDIERVKNYDRKCHFYDCYLDEVYGSINMCQCEGIINPNEGDYLREKYYFGLLDKGVE